ncbi:PorV/PorQ family protein [Fulvivirgaceae bacterium BMA10]|uniref:PorV/PorQ family protein n=1 Tax=Splendidivirga corallicola TaxID=3051826 RepID=A0ABT8KRX1_9BACT|nr:PorV/PorQ family protein [Fulvivirgaceae bacterium BMA10]
MKRSLIIILLLLCLASGKEVYSQATSPKYSNEFLAIGVGAKSLGMSNTGVAHVSDVTSGYWNPAGLLDISSKYEFSLMHAEYFAGIAKYDYASFATPIDTSSHLGVSIIRFAIDDIPDTRFLYNANGAIDYNNIRFFAAADYAFIFSYARKTSLVPGLKLGANFKIIHRNVGNFANAWGFGLDAGAQLKIKGWQLGLMVRDITGTFNAWSHNSELVVDIYTQTGNEIPENSVEITLPKATIGVSRYFNIKERFGLLGALDLIASFDGKRNVLIKSDFASIDPNIGFEFNYLKKVFLRFGLGNFQEIKDFDESTYTSYQPNFGLGIRINNVFIDYALTDIGDQSESLYSHVFSLKVAMDKFSDK